MANDLGSTNIIAVGTPVNGTVSLGAGVVIFTPTTGYSGTASFWYTNSDSAGLINLGAQVTVTVAPASVPVTVTENTGSHVNVTCNGGNNGTIMVNTATGGSGSWLHLLRWRPLSVQQHFQRINGDHLHNHGPG